MVGRLQGTCGGIGGEATTVIIIRRIDFRAPLGPNRPNRLTNYIDVSTGCRLIILCPCVITEGTIQRNHNLLARNHWYESLGFLAKYFHSVPETD